MELTSVRYEIIPAVGDEIEADLADAFAKTLTVFLESSLIASLTVVDATRVVGVNGFDADAAGTKYPGIMLSPYLHNQK